MIASSVSGAASDPFRSTGSSTSGGRAGNCGAAGGRRTAMPSLRAHVGQSHIPSRQSALSNHRHRRPRMHRTGRHHVPGPDVWEAAAPSAIARAPAPDRSKSGNLIRHPSTSPGNRTGIWVSLPTLFPIHGDISPGRSISRQDATCCGPRATSLLCAATTLSVRRTNG